MLLRTSTESIDDVDWHYVRFANPDGSYSRVPLDDPAGSTRHDTESFFRSGLSFDQLLRAFDAQQEFPITSINYYGGTT